MNYTSISAYMSPKSHAHRPRPTSHLSVRPVGEGADIRELFSDKATSGTRVFSGTVVHVAAIALLVLIVRFLPQKVYESILPNRSPEDIVYLVDPGPGGGGGGGNKSPEPPKQAKVKAEDKINVPVEKPPAPVPEPQKVPDTVPEQLLNAPLLTLGAAPITAPGAISGANTNSRGSGTGSGVGPGTGSGLGPGSGGGTGGGVYNIGNGVTSPTAIYQPKPKYTADAMRAKVQGTVVMSAIVMPDGTVTDIKVTRSLDQSFGLDEEAKKTAAQWRFRPGTLKGEPVAVRILIELDFNLR
jgi:TonB family protein